MRYLVTHSTRYCGSEGVSVGHNEAWLTPRVTSHQLRHTHQLVISPEPSIRSARTDYFGNLVSQFSFNQGYPTLAVTATSEVEVLAPAERGAGPAWESVAAAVAEHGTPETLAANEFLHDSPRCRRRAEFAEYARASLTPGRPLMDGLRELLARFREDFRYESGSTTIATPIEQVFRDRHGVCQDFAHLTIAMLRSLGLAARYVSGYLRTQLDDTEPGYTGADASHAWLSVYGGELGWIDIDPTNNCFPGEGHVTVAWGREYGDVAPLKGVYIGGGTHVLEVEVEVRPLEKTVGELPA